MVIKPAVTFWSWESLYLYLKWSMENLLAHTLNCSGDPDPHGYFLLSLLPSLVFLSHSQREELWGLLCEICLVYCGQAPNSMETHSFPLNPYCFWGSWGFVQGCVLLGWCISNELVPELNVFVVLSLSIEALESHFWTSVYLSTSLSCLYRHRNGSSCSPVGESSISSSSSVLQLLLSRHAWFSRDTNGAYCQLCMITGTTAFTLMACLEIEPGLEYVHFQTWQVKIYEMLLVDTFCSLQCG